MVREKEKEGDELRASIAESNEESEANIEMKRRQTQNNIKVDVVDVHDGQRGVGGQH